MGQQGIVGPPSMSGWSMFVFADLHIIWILIEYQGCWWVITVVLVCLLGQLSRLARWVSLVGWPDESLGLVGL